jgi:transposase
VLGALNAITHELVTVTHDPSITATEVCTLLRHLAARNLGVPVPVILDHAHYQRCAQGVPLAAGLPIELCVLPPYSPNLNLIERLWQCVKKQGLSSPYYADFAAFKTALVQCLAQTQTTHRAALDSLLTLRFQLFAKVQFFPA